MGIPRGLGAKLIPAIAITMVFVLVVNEKYGELTVSLMQNIKENLKGYDVLVNNIRSTMEIDKAICYKINENDSYQICDKLPFTSTSCARHSDSREKKLVPNVVHYVWFGDRIFQFYDYLSIRSAAANQKPDLIMFHYSKSEPQGDLWIRAKGEIPCLMMVRFNEPTTWKGHELDTVVHKTDIARFIIFIQYGGIYLDSDAIILRSMDSLRKYEFTMGRSVMDSLSGGVMLSKPNSTFIYKWSELYKTYTKAQFFTKASFQIHQLRPDIPIHVEETSLQRPNPWCDGPDSIYIESYNISENYILHLHPTRSGFDTYKTLREDEVRVLDTTYGAGARAALFGTQDLIFLTSEASKAHNRSEQKSIRRFKAIEKLPLPEKLPGF